MNELIPCTQATRPFNLTLSWRKQRTWQGGFGISLQSLPNPSLKKYSWHVPLFEAPGKDPGCTLSFCRIKSPGKMGGSLCSSPFLILIPNFPISSQHLCWPTCQLKPTPTATSRNTMDPLVHIPFLANSSFRIPPPLFFLFTPWLNNLNQILIVYLIYLSIWSLEHTGYPSFISPSCG